MGTIPPPDGPLRQLIIIRIVDLHPQMEGKYQNILFVEDRFSRLVEVYPAAKNDNNDNSKVFTERNVCKI